MAMLMKIGKLLSFLVVVLLTVSVAQASDIGSKSELESLRKRIDRLEGKDAGEEEENFLSVFADGKHISFWGAVEVEAGYSKTQDQDSSSDLMVATAQLGLDLQVNEVVGGHIVFLHEEDDTDLAIDEANIVLRPWEVGGGEVAFVFGLAYLPFGQYNSSMLSDPFTLEMGETSNSIAMASWGNDKVEVSFGFFNGDTDLSNDSRDFVDSSFASLSVTPMDMLSVGISYISDLTESGGEIVDPTAAPYNSNVAGLAAFISLEVGPVVIDVEHVTALEEFDLATVNGDPADDLSGQKPRASNVEIAVSPIDKLGLAVRYERTRDYKDDLNRYGLTASYGLYENTLVAVEYMRENPDVAGDDTDTLTAQLAFEF